MEILGWLSAAAAFAVQLALFYRWLHRKMRDDEITRVFVRDMATNHLPHIYAELREIAAKQGRNLKDPPRVQFVDFQSRKRSHG